MSSKRIRSAHSESRFINTDAENAFLKLRRDCGVTVSKTLLQDRLSFPIVNLFMHTPLIPLLTLAFPFHSTLLFEFFANLIIDSDRTTLASRVYCLDVIITKQDLSQYLSIPCTGPSAHFTSHDLTFSWIDVNKVIRNTNLHDHHHSVTGLVQDARVIQHVLRHTILPKAGDRTNITPLLSLVTFYCMTHTSFDVADLLIRYIENISSIRDPRAKKKHNLSLGHIISFVLQNKYTLANTEEPDHPPSYFSDHSFHTLYAGKKKQPAVEEEEEEEDAAPQGESSAPPDQRNTLSARVGRLEQSLNQHILDTHTWRQQWVQQQEQQHNEDRAWLQAQFDSLRKPPSGDPADF